MKEGRVGGLLVLNPNRDFGLDIVVKKKNPSKLQESNPMFASILMTVCIQRHWWKCSGKFYTSFFHPENQWRTDSFEQKKDVGLVLDPVPLLRSLKDLLLFLTFKRNKDLKKSWYAPLHAAAAAAWEGAEPNISRLAVNLARTEVIQPVEARVWLVIKAAWRVGLWPEHALMLSLLNIFKGFGLTLWMIPALWMYCKERNAA